MGTGDEEGLRVPTARGGQPVRARPVILVLSPDGAAGAVARALADPAQQIVEAGSSTEAETLVGRGGIDVVVLDLALARDSLEFLHVLPERARDLPVVAVQPRGGRDAGVEAARLGATWVVERDDDPVGLRSAVARAGELHALRSELERLRREAALFSDRVPLMGRSDVVRVLRERLDELVARAAPVLLIGPPGTGRQSVARDLHARSPRAGAPFVSVACDAALDETLLESQIFGHRRGAFPGATHDRPGACRLAVGGTLLLQRLDLLPQRLQSRLVDVLRTGRCLAVGAAQAVETDFRLVASAIQDIEALSRAGRFRDDLRGLLAPGTLRIPPLRTRPEDVAFLAEAYAAEEAERLGVAARRITHDCLATLTAHSWPGNVRELRQAIRHAFAATLSDVVRPDDLPATVRAGARIRDAPDPGMLPTLAESEAQLVALALEESRGNKTLAARRLGIDRKRLYRKIRRYSLLLPGEEDAVEDAEEAD